MLAKKSATGVKKIIVGNEYNDKNFGKTIRNCERPLENS